MRIGLFFMLLCLCQLCAGGGKSHWSKRMKKLENKVRKLESRLDKLERGFCSRPDCPPGFIRFKKYCLMFVIGKSNLENWHQARDDCKRRGADLVTINSRKKELFISRYFQEHFPNDNVEMYTGLVVSNEPIATTPLQIQSTTHSSSGQSSIRWVSSNKSILTSNTPFQHHQRSSFAAWSPRHIRGTSRAPSNSGICFWHHCVTISLKHMTSSKSKLELLWLFSCCAKKLNYICEVRKKKSICG